ncbi:DNA polymerase III subunit delta [Bacteroidota bacterium]
MKKIDSIVSYSQILNDLKNKNYKPIYFLMGEEPYYIDKISEFILNNILNEDEKTFNQTVLYGKDTDIETIDITARRFPMMASHHVVVIKEAQYLKNIENLKHYIGKPLNSTILVMCYKHKSFDKRKQIYKILSKSAVIFESNKLYDNKVPGWIAQYLKSHNCTIDPGAGQIMNEFLGNDLSKIANELDKLMLTLPSGSNVITTSHIEENIGISKDYNSFELTKALAQKNSLKAYRIVDYFGKNQKENHINKVISSLYYFFSKVLSYYFINDKTPANIAVALQVHPFFVRDYQQAAQNYSYEKVSMIISYLREYDTRSKGVNDSGTQAGELLREMVYKILH